jgi:tRNA-specific 2-thiouridylase
VNTKHRIVVGLSGGVDSSVAAWLLKKAGHEVVGIFMKNWEDDDTDEYCSSRQDLIDAASVADVVGIELQAVNFAAEYRDRVFAAFLREYAAGRTPNPDVLCNSEIKFRSFLDHARMLGADHLATGHYARLRHADGNVELLKAADASKDQTYFLHQLAQDQLVNALFPVGDMTKRQVRALAREQGIPTYAKKDSTGICFIGERPFREFLARYLPRQSGPMRTPDGVVVGRHQGLAYYTLGQRQGLGIGGTHGGSSEPWFVAGKDPASNALLVVQGHNHRRLYSSVVETGPMHWIAGTPPQKSRLAAKTRYRMPDASCVLEPLPESHWRARFDAPQWAPTPGQYLVVYDGEVCLGGAVIESARDEEPATGCLGLEQIAASRSERDIVV